MSVSSHPQVIQNTVLPSESSNTDVERVATEIDVKLRELSDRILPPQPYLLSVPSDVPYRYNSCFINTWHFGTPFDAVEEELQYMSFLPHQTDHESLLKVVGGWADVNGNPVDDDDDQGTLAPPSGQTTPLPQPARKKISLKDYKTKDQKRDSTPTLRVPAKSDGLGAAQMDSRHWDTMSEEKHHSQPGEEHLPENTLRKRNQSSTNQDSTRHHAAKDRQHDVPSPRKRRRLTPEGEAGVYGQDIIKDGSASRKTLPNLLSPTLPASKGGQSARALPDLLSPALPPALEKALASPKGLYIDHVSSRRTDHVRSILGEALGVSSEKKPAEKNNYNHNAYDGNTPATKVVAPKPAVSPSRRPATNPDSRPTTPAVNGAHANSSSRPSQPIRLRYGKRNRKHVESLLRLPPRPQKIKPVLEEKRLLPIPQREAFDDSRVEKKRSAEISLDLVVKKQKPTPEKPRNSAMAGLKSPAPVASLAKPRPEPVTPRKELKPDQKAGTMARITSTEGYDASTPSNDGGRLATPIRGGVRRASPVATGAFSRDGDRAAWTELGEKWYSLGRILKKEGLALSEKKSDQEQAQLVVLSIEALLCFMVHLAAQTTARSGTDPGWATIIPYHIQVFRQSRKYRHLHGLVTQLGAVSRQYLHNHNIDKLWKDPLPDESCGSAPTPGSDGNTKTDDAERYKRRYMEFRDDLVQNSRELQVAWMNGSRALSPYTIELEYPKTWGKRTKDAKSRGLEKLNPAQLSHEWFLPLDPASTAFEAARFALALLGEWAEKQKVAWTPRLEL